MRWSKYFAFRLSVILLALIQLFVSSAVAADSLLFDAAVLDPPSCAEGAPSTNNYGNKVNAGTTTTITKVDFLVSSSTGVSTDSVKIYSNSGIGSSGTLMGTLSYSAIQAVSTYYRASFTGSVQIPSTGIYWFIYFGSTYATQICMEANAPTVNSGWDIPKTSAPNYDLVNNSSAFSYPKHFSMEVFNAGVVQQTSLSISSISPAPKKLIVSTLSAQGSAPGTVTFYLKGLPISKCKNVPTNGSFTASCSWKPNVQGIQTISAKFIPTDSNSYYSSSASSTFNIGKRTSSR